MSRTPLPKASMSRRAVFTAPLRHFAIAPQTERRYRLGLESIEQRFNVLSQRRHSAPTKAQQQMLFIWRIRRSDDPSSRQSHSYAAPPLPHLFIDALESKATLSKMRISMMWRERSGKSALQYFLSLSLSPAAQADLLLFCLSVYV